MNILLHPSLTEATLYKATGTFTATAPADVSSAVVMEQTTNVWDDGGNLISTAGKQRFDNATGNGALGGPVTAPTARASYTAIYPDALGRTQATANYGTNAAAAWTRPATIPARSNTVLVTSTAYTPAGNVGTVTDPAGILTSSTRDNADRLITVVENQPGSSSSSSSSSSGYATDVRTTRYEYTDDGWLKKLKSDNQATGQQVTEWVYGVTPALGSALYSNRLVYQKKYPDTTGGTDLVTYQYNRQLQTTAMTDQAGTAHSYAYDQLGRLRSDSVGVFGSLVDNYVNKLENEYNNRGLLIRSTSLFVDTVVSPPAITVRNEVKWAYNDFNQPTDEYQAHDGGVNFTTSPKVHYGYVDGTGNTIRPTGLTSPDGSAVSWDYVSTLAGALSRPDAVKESSGGVTVATFKFLGVGKLVSLKYDAASSAEWTMRNGASSGDAGDVYTGLDRFGRLVETIWQAGSTELVHTTYGRNRVGGVTWQRNVLAHAISPATVENTRQDNFYWYDGLQQNYQHQRGDLAGTAPNYTGITNLQQTEIRSFDETGNWLSNYTSSPALTQSRTHNKANEITTISGVTAPTFDGTGNMKTMPKPGAWGTNCTLTWDAWNRLVTVTFTEGTTTTTINNRYDALTRRISKSITGGEVRDYYYDKQWRSIEERLSGTFSGLDKTRHLWSPFERWTLIRRQRETGGSLTDTHFCLKDYLDPTALITSAAAVVERFSYDAFGPVRFMNAAFVTQSSSSYAWTLLFHGEFIDTESGLYNYGYRFYHPSLGRWLSRDPIGEKGGENLYKTVNNNTANRVDFLGLKDCNTLSDIHIRSSGEGVKHSGDVAISPGFTGWSWPWQKENVFWYDIGLWINRASGCTTQFIQLARNSPKGLLGIGGAAKPFWDVPGASPNFFTGSEGSLPPNPFYPKDATGSFADTPGEYNANRTTFEVCVVCVNNTTGHYDAIGPCHTWKPSGAPEGGTPPATDLGTLPGEAPSAGFMHRLDRDYPGKVTDGTKRFDSARPAID